MRITEKMLQAKVNELNKATGNPETYATRKDGKLQIHVGHYHIDQNIGGVQLVQTMNDGGGVNCPLGYSRGTKRELFDLINAMLIGKRL